MRRKISAIFFCCCLVVVRWCFSQGEQPTINIDKSAFVFEKVKEDQYRLRLSWAPISGANQYRVRFSESADDVSKPDEQLVSARLTEDDTTGMLLSLKTNICYLQVQALNEASQEIAESGVYRASLTFTERSFSSGLSTIFLSAIASSFNDMDPFAGWAIIIAIILLFVYGSYMAWIINDEVKVQNHCKNGDLEAIVKGFKLRWLENRKNFAGLQLLRDDLKKSNNPKRSILSILENGLENHINNFSRDNVSEEVDRDMEKAIANELESIKLGSCSRNSKYVSLNRIKLLSEIAPMLGLLGTVCGLIIAFFNILETTESNTAYDKVLSVLSAGIYSAILTTIIGLIAGIALLFIHHAAESNIKRMLNNWQNVYSEISRHIAPEPASAMQTADSTAEYV